MRGNKIARPGVGAPERVNGHRDNHLAMSVKQSITAAPSGQLHIADYLSRGRGNALTRRDLERLTNLDGRSVRLLIERERRAGTPILADSTNGYYLPATNDERAACVRSLRHRAREILTTARAIEQAEG